MRKQYHFQPGVRRLDAWDVDRLVSLTREVAAHVRLTNEVDVEYPIILGADGRVMDGMHRVLRALVEGRESIDAVQFDVDPEPDYLDVAPHELPYPDADPN